MASRTGPLWVVAALGLGACGLDLGTSKGNLAGGTGPRHTPGAFDPGTATFRLKGDPDAGIPDNQFVFGVPGDLPVFGDFNDGGQDTVGVYRNGVFYLRYSNSTGYADLTVPFGMAGDLPLAGCWQTASSSEFPKLPSGDCDQPGPDRLGVYRPDSSTFYLRESATAVNEFVYGIPGDVPFVGDWDGDGRDTVAVYRPSNGYVYLRNTNGTGYADRELYLGPGVPIAADWNGDRGDSVAMYQPDAGTFKVWWSTNPCQVDADHPDEIIQFGPPHSAPLGGHWALPPP